MESMRDLADQLLSLSLSLSLSLILTDYSGVDYQSGVKTITVGYRGAAEQNKVMGSKPIHTTTLYHTEIQIHL
jgi:F420-0:gamma-glutamyl ligase